MEEFFKQTTEHWFISLLIGLWTIIICCIRIHFYVNEEEDKRG